MLDLDLCDIWRVRNPEGKRFTWNGKAGGRKSSPDTILLRRLDYFFVSDELQPYAEVTVIITNLSTGTPR